jgi:hypothetical protein
MLVDMTVRNHEVAAAKPTKEIVPPIILVRTESGCELPAVEWSGSGNRSGYGLEERLQRRSLERDLQSCS